MDEVDQRQENDIHSLKRQDLVHDKRFNRVEALVWATVFVALISVVLNFLSLASRMDIEIKMTRPEVHAK